MNPVFCQTLGNEHQRKTEETPTIGILYVLCIPAPTVNVKCNLNNSGDLYLRHLNYITIQITDFLLVPNFNGPANEMPGTMVPSE